MSVKYSRLALEPNQKRMIAEMENFGNTTGNWAQMTAPPLDDIRDQGYFKNYTNAEIMANPDLYNAAAAAYWDKGRPLRDIDPRVRALAWLAPGRFKDAGGDVEKIKAFKPYDTDEKARKVFRDRLRNSAMQRALYNQYRAERSTEDRSIGTESEALLR